MNLTMLPLQEFEPKQQHSCQKCCHFATVPLKINFECHLLSIHPLHCTPDDIYARAGAVKFTRAQITQIYISWAPCAPLCFSDSAC